MTPLTVETELENDDIICASGDSLFGNPGIAGRDYEEDQAIYVIDAGGYIGESTKSEIEYAQRNGKKVMYLEPVD